MTERMPVLPLKPHATPDEAWWAGDGFDWYAAAADKAVGWLGPGADRRCLVVGSPIEEANTLWRLGWDVTYLDCREPPEDLIGGRVVVADAAAIPYPDAAFDAASSTCVLCHAGLGRYGDPVRPNGDVAVLAEIARVLRPGGRAALMVGPTLWGLSESLVVGNVHRVYSVAGAGRLVDGARLECLALDRWDGERWRDADTPPAAFGLEYLTALVRKPL